MNMNSPTHPYRLNEETKRLEPTDTLCQFCETDHSTKMDDNYFVTLYKEKDRTNVIVYRSVKFNSIPVGIPRCEKCMVIHESASLWGNLLGWVIAIAFVILIFALFGPWGFLAILGSIFLGVFGSQYLENWFVRKKQIYTRKEGARQNEAVQDLVLGGWSFNQPMA
jgi:hypothetical protein